MNAKITSIIFAVCFFEISTSTFAETTARQTISATLSPLVSVTNVQGAITNVNINHNGQLSSNLTPAFKFNSNNPNGITATFTVQVNTADGSGANAIYGMTNNSSGKIVLANTSKLPSNAAIINALSTNPNTINNANVISYVVSFISNNTTIGYSPVFDQSGTSAKSKVLKKNGSNIISVFVDKNLVEKNTFGQNDAPGVYQANIYCTTAAL